VARAAIIVAGMALHEFLGHFVGAAAAADRRFVRTGDAAEIRAGIEVWEQFADDGALAAEPPEVLVEVYLAVSMLYARRHEAGDVSRALRYLEQAQRHVVPGSFADMQARMSRAACLMVRYQADGRAEDLDAAIDAWAGLLRTEARPLAAANLGRALVTRGRAEDLPEGRRLLGLASAEMPHDHPARRDVELALRAAG
jgi:hypothetical protein